MASLARLLLVACAIAAPIYAASIPDLQKKIPTALPDDIKDSPVNANHEVISPEPAKEVENELRTKPEDIPVEVVVENVEPSVKLNEVDDEEIKRPAVDLRNPGPPQRQEHETQNPEQHSDELFKVSTIKENIEQTQQLLRKSFQDVSDNIQNWFYKNDDENKIHNNIQNLRNTFSIQIQKLNDTIQTLVKPEASEPVESQEESQRNYKQIQSRLKILKDNFNNNVETLSAGMELVASLRSSAEGDAVKEESTATPSEPAAAVPSQNFIAQVMNTMNTFMNSTISAIQNFGTTISGVTPAPPASAQADTPAASTVLPTWQNPFAQIANVLSNQTNNINNFWNTIIRRTTVKPAEAVSSSATDKPVATPVVSSQEGAADKPADASAPAPVPAQPAAAEPVQPVGPIRQLLSNIPVVQLIQNSLNNRDTPREPAGNSNAQTKGGWYGPPGRPGGSGDNNDSRVSEQKSEKIEEPIKEEAIKDETIKEESIKEEPIKNELIKEESKKEEAQVRPEPVPEKTE